jgi:hypothetical protein
MPYINIFGTARRRRKKFWFFFGSKCSHIYTFLTQAAAGEKILFFLGGGECCHIYTFLEFNFCRKNEKKKQYPPPPRMPIFFNPKTLIGILIGGSHMVKNPARQAFSKKYKCTFQDQSLNVYICFPINGVTTILTVY